MDKFESSTETEAGNENNYLPLILYRAPEWIHEVDAARHYSKIKLSLSDYADPVSALILPNLLGASSNNRGNGFVAPRIVTIYSWNFGLDLR
jgi:hypothetical protein